MMTTQREATYTQVSDILDRVHDYHRHFRAKLEEANSDELNDQTTYLLNWLRSIENQEVIIFEQLQQHRKNQILQTWIQYVPDGECLETLKGVQLEYDMQPNELTEQTR